MFEDIRELGKQFSFAIYHDQVKKIELLMKKYKIKSKAKMIRSIIDEFIKEHPEEFR